MMRKAKVFVNQQFAGILQAMDTGIYVFEYDKLYQGLPVSLTMPVQQKQFSYEKFPPFFEGLLPEGMQLEALLRRTKIDPNDLFGQLIQVGADLVGNTTVMEIT